MKYNYFTVVERVKPESWNGLKDKPEQSDYLVASVVKIAPNYNLYGIFGSREIVSVNLFEGGKKEAERIAAGWNELYKRKGVYAY